MPVRFLPPTAEASFLAYLHYLEDIAGVIGGLYGFGVEGIYQSLQLHPPVRALEGRRLDAQQTADVNARLGTAWTALRSIDNAVREETYHLQANAVLPGLALDAVVATASALSAIQGHSVEATDDVLTYLSERVGEELLPYPWSAFCVGCPQLGDVRWGGSALPADFVSVFSLPDPGSSDARLAMLLRTTRTRILERRFAEERRTDVRPGRSRRNLTREHKELIAASIAPTTLFDVFVRLRDRVERDDGEAFAEAPYDDVEGRRFASALAIVADASVAAIEAVVAQQIGWELFADLLGSSARRSGVAAPPVTARLAAVPVSGLSG